MPSRCAGDLVGDGKRRVPVDGRAPRRSPGAAPRWSRAAAPTAGADGGQGHRASARGRSPMRSYRPRPRRRGHGSAGRRRAGCAVLRRSPRRGRPATQATSAPSPIRATSAAGAEHGVVAHRAVGPPRLDQGAAGYHLERAEGDTPRRSTSERSPAKCDTATVIGAVGAPESTSIRCSSGGPSRVQAGSAPARNGLGAPASASPARPPTPRRAAPTGRCGARSSRRGCGPPGPASVLAPTPTSPTTAPARGRSEQSGGGTQQGVAWPACGPGAAVLNTVPPPTTTTSVAPNARATSTGAGEIDVVWCRSAAVRAGVRLAMVRVAPSRARRNARFARALRRRGYPARRRRPAVREGIGQLLIQIGRVGALRPATQRPPARVVAHAARAAKLVRAAESELVEAVGDHKRSRGER